MGEEEFRIGIKRFLENNKYGNAVTNDLWKELEAISSTRLNITHIMDTWTRQMGYPIIQVMYYNIRCLILLIFDIIMYHQQCPKHSF